MDKFWKFFWEYIRTNQTVFVWDVAWAKAAVSYESQSWHQLGDLCRVCSGCTHTTLGMCLHMCMCLSVCPSLCSVCWQGYHQSSVTPRQSPAPRQPCRLATQVRFTKVRRRLGAKGEKTQERRKGRHAVSLHLLAFHLFGFHLCGSAVFDNVYLHFFFKSGNFLKPEFGSSENQLAITLWSIFELPAKQVRCWVSFCLRPAAQYYSNIPIVETTSIGVIWDHMHSNPPSPSATCTWNLAGGSVIECEMHLHFRAFTP